MIEHVSPWCFWGYILMLEGLALTQGPWLLNEISQYHGEPAASFVKVHAADDVAHMAEAEKALHALPDRERPLVVDQIANSCFHYCAMLTQCTAQAGPRRFAGAQPASPEAQSV
jgi:hypothetical protein